MSNCGDGTRVITQTYVYNLLYNGSFVDQYSHYYACGGDYWTPEDPSTATGDPNLP
jgi:hypothetical protein